ncbi:MAG: cytochrome C oxidase subunit IV family protein [Polyangiaceae bacterium]|nr:cytochrome C oxidase subunit IV family protein [Polyangiaceae bacterium]
MADDKNKSLASDGDEDDVKTAVETVDAKRAATEAAKSEPPAAAKSEPPAAAKSEPPAAAKNGDSDEDDGDEDDSDSDDDGDEDDDSDSDDDGDEDDSEDDGDEDDGDEAPAASDAPPPAAAKTTATKRASVPAAKAGGAYRERPAAHDPHHGLAHVMPVKLLVGVLAVLLVLTVATVAVTSVDLGSQWNLVVAMVIATIKAVLVCAFFMHLIWDRKFNLLVFMSSVLFLALFLGLALTDRREYQKDIDQRETDQAALQAQ